MSLLNGNCTPTESLSGRFARVFAISLLLVFVLCGCASTRQGITTSRSFDFQRDTFSFANELVWTYEYDANGKWTTHRRQPRPDYTQHCFVLSRSTRQFFLNARFDATQPVSDESTYRRLVR